MKFVLEWQCDPFGWHDVRTGEEHVEAADMVEACVIARKQIAERLKVNRHIVHITTGTMALKEKA